MPSYFRQLPSFEYVSRLPDAKIGDYIQVKNLFKKGKLREDIFQNLSFFEKYKVIGDDRPDNVAYEIYNDSSLDWVILISNNIINIQSEWPLTQDSFDTYLKEKYGVGLTTEEEIYAKIYDTHHYETTEIKNSQGVVIVPAGLQVEEGYSVSYYDFFIDSQVDTGDITVPVTNYEYEEKIENEKRNIYVLKPRYLNIVIDDMKDIMAYKKGSSQYISEDLKRADNIRLFS